jgi:hypothetical protein
MQAERDNLYWLCLMREQGGPDGSDHDDAVEEDGQAALAAIRQEMDAMFGSDA